MVRYPRILAGLLLVVASALPACSSDSNSPTTPEQPSGTPGIKVEPTSGLTTTEAGGTAVFGIVLDAQPTSNVTIALSSSDTSEGTPSPVVVTFTPTNWDAPQKVTVKGVDDTIADGPVAYTITTAPAQSADTRYDAMNASDVSVTNTDNETPGITVEPVAGLVTTEGGGTDQFTVVLNAAPSADVTIPLSSTDETEGTVAPAQLVFTKDNWNAPQAVTVTGADDDEADGDQTYSIVTAPAQSGDTGYDGVDAEDVDVSNTDNDSPGVTVEPTLGLTTTESGGTATFTIVLNSAPTADVTIGLASDDDTEGTASPASVTFTSQNWSGPQTVTVTGVDDALADGNQVYTVVTAAAVSTDTGFDGIDPDDVVLSNTDDESPGVTVEPLTGLTTTESGGTATFTIVLNSEPTADVSIGLSSSDEGEGVVSPAAVTFTAANWNAPQTVTVTGVEDALADGDQVYTIVTAAATSADTGYEGLDPDDVELTNTDNDSPGITVNPITGLTTTEAGGTATFTVVLNSQPANDVVIPLSSSDLTEGTVSPAAVTFTTANWNAPQTVTVTGVDDLVADGNQPYTILTDAAVSSDAAYSGIDAANVAVSNTDNDSAGITVEPVTGLITTEAGGTATFTVVLNTPPSADVTIGLSSDNVAEGTISAASLTFTAANWNAPQTVTVTGVDDLIADGNQPYSILTAAAVSTDATYNGIDAANVAVSNTDNDSAGVTVEPMVGLITTESGGTDTFTIVLNTQPSGDVTIDLSSSDVGEGTVSPAVVTFTAANWNAPQTITVTGVDDLIADGAQPFTVLTAAAVSTDANYNGIDAANVGVSNTDNDSAGVTVEPMAGLVTTEAGGTDVFTIVLNSEPTADVTIALASSDLGEGAVSPASVTFTTANWNAPQTVTVTGVDDLVADGAQQYSITTAAAVSADTNYDGIDAANVTVSNTDNDSAGVTVAPMTGLVTTEAGGTDTFTIVLNSQPTADVTIALSSSDAGEGVASPVSVTFTTANWNAPQTVTVTGADDAVQDGAQPYTILTAAAVSTDLAYNGVDASNVSVSNTDNDSAGITVAPTAGLVTTEGGASTTFTIVLNTQPTADVTIGLSSSDATEGTVSPAAVTFTTANWNAPRTVTLTGVDDAVQDGNQPYTIITAAAASSDANYNNIDPSDVTASNTDNDTAGIIVSPTTGLTTTEGGGTANFSVVLTTQPTASVTIPVIASSDTTEGTINHTTLVFTTLNWNAPQSVTVTGVNDAVADGSQPYTITLSAATSADANYAGIDPQDVSVTNTDNDSAGITVSPVTGLSTSESGGVALFSIRLNSQPTAGVTIGLSSSDTSEGAVSPNSVSFTTANWNAPQFVTITGVEDAIQDGDQQYTIITAAATSADASYQGLNASDVSVTNIDNDTPGITVTPTHSLVTTEAGGTATFSIVLNSMPGADVQIPLSSSDLSEGTVSPASLTFTAANWNAPQTVTVTGVDDSVQDGNQPYSIITAVAQSTDLGYSGLNAADVSVSNTDNDSAGITVAYTPSTGLTTTEAGGTATFSIVLNSQPVANVVVPLSSSDIGEGTISSATVTFTAANWNSPQIITVTGVNDLVADGNQPYTILTGPATSTDSGYAGMDAADVPVTNTDNDSAGITVDGYEGMLVTTEAGGSDTFTIVLNSEPTANVTIPLTSGDLTEGAVAPASVTFTPLNWNAPQTVTVTGVDDAVADGAQQYTIQTGAAVSADTSYSGMNAADVLARNTDNDSAGITVVYNTNGLVTTEAGGSDTFTVVLNSQPTANVTIALSSSDTSEGLVAPVLLTFTPANWGAPQTVTVTGVDDAVEDGARPYTIMTAPAGSSDATYNGLDAVNVPVTNTDNDTAGITVTFTPQTGLTTTEAGGTATFTIVLNSEPTDDVVIALSSSDTTEGAVLPASVTFTALNWNAPRTITVTGQDDAVQDGNQVYSIATAAAVSSDSNYQGINPIDVPATNTDNDSAGVTVTAAAGLTTTEAGGTATFTIALNSEPTQDVAITLTSSDLTEGTVSPASITFTSVNWSAPRTITITGVNDAVQDGNQPFQIITSNTVSTDPNYDDLVVNNVSVTNTDNDTAGVTVAVAAGFTTSEGGTSNTFTIALNSEPTDDVTIAVSSNDLTEGTVSPASVTFTPINWAAPQTVTVTGVNDDVADGDQPYTIVTSVGASADANYNGITVADVAVTNIDNDSAGVMVNAGTNLFTTEAGGQATFTIVLNSQPFASVAIALSSNDTTEGTVSPASLTFTTANWNAPQTVTVTGVNDLVADGDQPYTIVTGAATSSDSGYEGMVVADVAIINVDNDTAGFQVTPSSGLTTSESGGVALLTIALTSRPTANVTIPLSSSDPSEGTVSPASLTFTAGNWNVPRSVTVTGVDDLLRDGNQPYLVVTGPAVSADSGYSGLNAVDAAITNTDNDSPGISITPTSGLSTTESGGTATFSVVLNAIPTADVTLTLFSSDLTEGTMLPANITFTTANWSVPQTITVTGIDDFDVDGNQPYFIRTNPLVSADLGYHGLDPADVSVSNTDND